MHTKYLLTASKYFSPSFCAKNFQSATVGGKWQLSQDTLAPTLRHSDKCKRTWMAATLGYLFVLIGAIGCNLMPRLSLFNNSNRMQHLYLHFVSASVLYLPLISLICFNEILMQFFRPLSLVAFSIYSSSNWVNCHLMAIELANWIISGNKLKCFKLLMNL